MSDVPALKWTRTHPGRWVTDAPINGEDGAFEAVAVSEPGAGWWVTMTAYARPLDTAEVGYLTDARKAAQDTYDAVEGVNR